MMIVGSRRMLGMMATVLMALAFLAANSGVQAWMMPQAHSHYKHTQTHQTRSASLLAVVDDAASDSGVDSRWACVSPQLRRTFLTASCVGLLATALPLTASADATTPAAPTSTVYITGKAPRIPGKKPQAKDDLKGTRKDPSFLRSIAECKTQCLSTDTYGTGKTKEDCLSECQDVCCTTYEQCTFAIVPRL